MKKVDIKSIVIPNRSRSGNYPTGSTVTPSGGGSNSTIINQGGGVDLTQARKEFLSKKTSDEAKGIINFLKGIKIAGRNISNLLQKNSEEEITDEAIMSAARVILEIGNAIGKLDNKFLRKDQSDSTNFLLKLLGGAEFGVFASGISGANIDAQGAAELLSLVLRGALTIGEYKKGLKGANIDKQGVADLLSILVRNGMESANFSTGALGAGFCLKKDENGDSYLEVDRMLVRKVATFIRLLIQQIKHVGGQIILTPASMSCVKVEDKGDFYRCYFENTDGERTIEQEFEVGDLARAQTFNVKEGVNENVTNTYYWRAVVGVGDNYIDLSKTDCDTGSTEPKAGDDIVQLGNKSDATRQAAIILSAYGNDAPYFKLYRGINSYSLDGKEFASFSRSEVMIIADAIKFSSGESVKDYIDNAVGEVNTKVDDAISDLSENISFVNQLSKDLEAVKNQIDGAIETWFYEPVPTLSNEPAVNWTTNEDKNVHLGDLYYDGNGKAYRFQVSGSKYTWQVITDSDITKALADAKKAQDTADGKRRVFVTTPSNASVYDIGDLWVNATYGSYKNDLLRCKTAKQANAQFSIEHWELASKYTDDTKANQAQAAADAAKQAADSAQQTANNAVQSAATANALLSDIANDNKLTAQEKQETKKEWDIIVSEKPKNNASADKYGVSRTAYDTAYNTLSAYITPLLSSLSTTSNISGAAFRSKFKDYYDARTDLLNAISAKAKSLADAAQQTADAAQEKANQAIKDAANAKAAADNAQSDADEAKSRLDSWASDGSISPTEKQSLKEEIARIDADKTQIANGYSKYNLGTPTNYNNAHTTYRAVLVTLTASSPETIAIPSDFSTKQTAYYTQRTNALTAISNAARDYAQGIANDLSSYKKTVSSQFEQTNNSITAAVTSSKEYTDSAVSGIQIGGRNYFAFSRTKIENNSGTGEYDKSINGAILTTGSKTTSKTIVRFSNFGLTDAGDYTLSCEIKATSDVTIKIDICDYTILNNIAVTSQYKKIKLTGRVVAYINGAAGYYGFVDFDEVSDIPDGVKIYIKNFKLESGNKATDWSPAPEDSENALTEYKKEVTAQFSVLEGEINSKVSSTEITTIKQEIINTAAADATNKVNNILIGGRNYVKNSKTFEGFYNLGTSAEKEIIKDSSVPSGAIVSIKITKIIAASQRGIFLALYKRFNQGDKLAYRFFIKASRNIVFNILGYEKGLKINVQVTTEWQEVSNIFTCNSASNSAFVFYSKELEVNDVFYVHSLKLEEGTKITDWSPAPEDADNKYATITTVTSMQTVIEQHSEDLLLKAEKTEVTAVQNNLNQTNNNLSALTTRVSKAEVALRPDNIWIGISSKVTSVSKITNIVPDSCFDDANYSLLYTGGSRVSAATANNSCPTSYCMKSTQRDVQAKNYVSVAEGEKYYISAYVNAQLANHTVTVGLILKKSDGTTSWHNNGSSVAAKTSGWRKLSGYITIPAGYTKAGIWFQIDGGSNFGSAYFTKVYAYKVDSNRNNLALNSKGPWTANKYQLVTYLTFVQPLTKGAIYTVSWKGSGTGSLNVYFSNGAASSARQIVKNGIPVTANSNYQGITFFSERFKLDPSLETDNGINLTVKEVKVEKGERATDWCYSDGDYSTTEQIKTGITVKENAISIFGKDVSLQGKITFSSLNSSLQSTINNKADSGDVTSVINSSKEDMAKKLGYASYADMVSAATAGNTIIEGGHIRTSLIEADALVVKTLNAVNAKGINTLVDKEGITLTDSSTKNVLLKTEIIGTSAASYAGSLVLKGGFSSGRFQKANLSAFSLTMSSDGGGTSDKYSINLSQYGLQVFTNSKGLSRPRILWCGYISSSGIISREYGNYTNVSVRRNSTGTYTVTHNLNISAYYVLITPKRDSYFPIACVKEQTSTYFKYATAYNAPSGGIYGLTDGDCSVFIAIIHSPSVIKDA